MKTSSRTMLAALVLLVALSAPQAVLAQLTPIPLNDCPPYQTLAEAVITCDTQRTLDVAALNQKNLMIPMSMPVRMATSGGRITMVPLLPTENMPADTVLIPVSVPVDIYSTPTSSCLSTDLDTDLVNTVLMMPCSVNGTTTMRPVQLKQVENRMMMLPLNMSDVKGPVSVPIYADGELMTIPLDCRTTADGITFCPRTAQGQINVMCR